LRRIPNREPNTARSPEPAPAPTAPAAAPKGERRGPPFRRRSEREAEAEAQAVAAAAAPTPAPRPVVPEGPRFDGDALMAELGALSANDFAALLSGGMPKRLRPGERVQGIVVRVGHDGVFVDLGSKSEGILDISDAEAGEVFTVGQNLSAFVLSVGERGVRLARRIGGSSATDVLEEARDTGIPVDGKVESRNAGGFTVRIGAVRAFCPVSQIDRHPDADLDSYIGRTLAFRVTDVRDRDVVVSHKAVAEVAAEAEAKELWTTLKEGDVRDGVVVGSRDFGLFVDIGGVRGLVYKRDISWDEEAAAPPQGARVRATVISVDAASKKVNLSLKEQSANPWTAVGTTYAVGGIFPGTVQRLAEFGAFVRLAPGVEGLVHLSNLADKRIGHPSEVLKVGDTVQVRVLAVDKERQRLDLGLRQASQDDWAPPAPKVGAPPAKSATLGTFADLFANVKIKR